MTRTAFTNARLIDPSCGLDTSGTLIVADTLIHSVGPDVSPDTTDEIIDCDGHIVMPGIVDMCSFALDPASAARGGISTVVLQPNANPVVDTAVMVGHVLREAKDLSPIRVEVMGAATKACDGAEMAEIGLMARAGARAFTDGRHMIEDASVMRRLLEYGQIVDALIVQHAEDPSLAKDGVMNEGEIATRLGLTGIPAAAEVIAIERDLRLLELAGGRLHIALVTTAEGIEVIRHAKAKGRRVTCGTAPHYFALNETAVDGYRTFAKVSPPLRNEADRKAVVAGIADGTIDVICSSHDPQDVETKRLPFAQAHEGIVGYETLLPLALEMHHNGSAPLMTVLKALTASPARILELPSGTLTPGAPADLIRVDLEAPSRIAADAFLSRTRNSPFDGRPVQGRVLETRVGGAPVHSTV